MTAIYTVRGYQDGSLVGELNYERLEIVRRFMNPGRVHMTVAIKQLPDDFLASYRSRIKIFKDGDEVLTAGLIGTDRTKTGKIDMLELNFRDGIYYIGGRLAPPVPAGPPYSANAHDTRTGAAETVIKNYINYNCGPLANIQRRWPWLTIETTAGRGSTVTGNARFDNLLTLCQDLALAGGIAFHVVSDDLKVFIPTDKSAIARFSITFANLEDYHYANDIATANYFVVGGGGDLTSRVFTEIGNSASILACGRWEDFADRRDTTDIVTMQREALDRLVTSTEKVQAHIEVVELPNMVFGTDFYLGDQVAIEIDGIWLTSVIQEHGILINQEQQKERVEVGPFGTSWNVLARPPFRRYVASLERRK